MRKLLLVRHGKAADNSDSGDFGRELKKSGIEDVEDLASRLKHKNIIPDAIYTSTAARAKATAEIIAEHLKIKTVLEVPDIYEAADKTLLSVINSISNDHKFTMLAGHNPAFSSVATYLTAKYISLGTADAVFIEFDTKDWAEVSGATGKVVWES